MKYFSVFLAGLFLLPGPSAIAQTEQPSLRERVDALSDRKYSESDVAEANELLPIVEESVDAALTFDLLDWLSDYYTNTGEYERAMNLCRKAADAARRSGDDERIADGAMNIGNIYYRTGDYEQSIATFEPLRYEYLTLGDSLKVGRVQASIAFNYLSMGKPDTALQQMLLARDALRKYGASEDWLTIDQNLGATYSLLGMPDRSLPYNRQCLSIILAERDTFSFAPAYGNLAYTYQQLNNFDRALTYYDSSLYYSRLLKQDAITYVTLFDLSEGYQTINDYKNALKYFQEYHIVQESVLGEKTQVRMAELKVAYETEQHKLALQASEEKVLLLENEARLRSQRLILIIIALFFTLLVALLIFRLWRRDIHYRATKEKLIAAELANERLTSSLLSTRLENKQGDLTDFALDIERKNKFSRQLADRLEALRKKIPGQFRQQLDELIRFTNGHDQLNEHLELVQENIDQVNHEFHQKLKEAYPNLTANDRTLAGLLRLNMTNKEVAVNRGISTASAKMARYRLRKKLNLAPTDDINAFLREL